MARATADPAARTPAQRLRDALQELASSDAAEVPTATALCELAGVSRNALYRYHTDVLHELHKLQHRRHRNPGKTDQNLQRLRDENDELQSRVSKLAALVDHYFAAWQETRLQLERRDRELAEVRRAHKPQVVSLHR